MDLYDEKIYPLKAKKPDKYNKIMHEAYKRTHKSQPTKTKVDRWSENFPVMLDRKIETEKRKLKEKIKDPKKRKEAQKRFQFSQLRNRNIISQLSKQGYYGVNEKSKRDKMKAGLKDDEIITDLVAEISDPYGGDHDMVEIDYDRQYRQHIKEYEARYKTYVVEDIPEKKEKKPIIKKEKIVPSKIKEKIKKIIKKPPEKKIKKKPISTLIISKNPIKITPIKNIEFIKPEPTPKPIKKPIKKKLPIKKKKPKPRKKPVIPKKPIKKKISVKKKRIPKKKVPKKKYPRAKKKGTSITGHWTARYRTIKGKKTKVMIRRRKGKIQIKKCI